MKNERLNKKIENSFSPKKDIVLSFDLFDTLVKREVFSPIDVYKIVENIYFEKTNKQLVNFVELRKNIEKKLWEKTENGEFTLDAIYENLKVFYPEDDLSFVKRIELFVEKNTIVLNVEMIDIFLKYAKLHKTIITSDMYLQKKYIEPIIEPIGIYGYSDLFISGEKCANKFNKGLYSLVKRKYENQQIIHIGDNFKDDYLKAKLSGISSYWYKDSQCLKLPCECFSTADSIVYGILCNYYDSNYWRKTGFQILGPLLLGFSEWIYSEVKKSGISNVIFLARDGYIVKKVFDILYADELQTEYMYISRKAAIVTNYKECKNCCDILKLHKFRQNEKWSEVLQRLGIDCRPEHDFEIKRKDLYNGKYDSLLNAYFDGLIYKSQKQQKYIMTYFQQLTNSKKVAVVDIGWNGTIQDSLCDVLGDSVDLFGLYLGLVKETAKKRCYLNNNNGFDYNIIPYTRGIFETFFSAPHGTTDQYQEINGIIEPVFSVCDVPLTTQSCINLLHEGALEFINRFHEKEKKFYLNKQSISEKLATYGMLRLVSCPSKEDATEFGNLFFNDTINRKLVSFNEEKGVISKIRGFKNSDWKVGYAKRVIRINISYGKIFAFFNRFRKG